MLSEETAPVAVTEEEVAEETQPAEVPAETTESNTTTETATPKKTNRAQIFCGNIAYTSTESAIEEYFSAFGEIANVLVAKKKQSEGSGHRGFAFISYVDNAIAQKVLGMDEHTLDGRKLTIKEAKPKTTKFFVGGLDRDKTDAESLRTFFQEYGEIVDCFCPSGKKFGFVTMIDDGTNIQRILEQGRFMLDGASVDVKPAQPKKDEMGRGGRDRFGGSPYGGRGGGFGGYGGMHGGPGWGGRGGYSSGYNPYGAPGGSRGGAYGGGYGMYGGRGGRY